MPEHAPTVESPGIRAANTWRCIGWCCILLVALGWRVLGITSTEVWRDEAITIIHTHADWADILFRLPWVEDTPPLIFLLFKVWSLINGQEWFLRLLPVLMGTTWVYMVMRTASLIHPQAWWTAGLIAAFSPLSVHFSQEIRGYSLLAMLTACCLWAVQRTISAAGAGKSARRWTLTAAAFGILAAHTHASGVFVFPATICYAIARTARTNWFRILRPSALLPWLIGILPMLWFARHWTAIHVAEGDWWISPPTLDTAKYIAERFLGLTALTDFSLANQSRWRMWLGFGLERAVIVAAAGLVAVGIAGRGSKTALGDTHSSLRRPVLALALAAVVFVGLLYLAGIVGLPGMLDRTVLPAWTPVVVMLGICGANVSNRRIQTVRVSMVICLAMAWAATWTWVVNAGPPRRPESARMFAWMRERLSPNDLGVTRLARPHNVL